MLQDKIKNQLLSEQKAKIEINRNDLGLLGLTAYKYSFSDSIPIKLMIYYYPTDDGVEIQLKQSDKLNNYSSLSFDLKSNIPNFKFDHSMQINLDWLSITLKKIRLKVFFQGIYENMTNCFIANTYKGKFEVKETGLITYNFSRLDARFSGAEIENLIELLEEPPHILDWYVKEKNEIEIWHQI